MKQPYDNTNFFKVKTYSELEQGNWNERVNKYRLFNLYLQSLDKHEDKAKAKKAYCGLSRIVRGVPSEILIESIALGVSLSVVASYTAGPALCALAGSAWPVFAMMVGITAIASLIGYLIQESYRKDVDGYLAVAQSMLEDPSMISREPLDIKEGTSIEMTTLPSI